MENNFSSKPRLEISACLLGQKVRYDGGHKRDVFLTEIFGPFVEWAPVCPELEVHTARTRPIGRQCPCTEYDRGTLGERLDRGDAEVQRPTRERAKTTRSLRLRLQKRLAELWLERVKIYSPKGGTTRDGRGLFAAALMQELPLLPVEEEGRLNDLVLRENFIERVFAYHRWRTAAAAKSRRGLVTFHTSHKYLFLAHSQRHYRHLGRLVAGLKEKSLPDAYEDYGRGFMEALAVHADAKKHANVLEHMLGYFSDQLSAAERQELVEVIRDFRRQIIPLIVPVTLIRHYVKKYAVAYLQSQVYLDPSPKELMLRNHV